MLTELTSVRVRSIDRGSGPPCLFLHGNPDTAEMWDGVISRLAPSFRCLAFDLPDFGGSQVTGDFDCQLETLASFVDEWVEAIGVELPVNLAVHDFGGPYGISWAVRHPDKVRRLAITNSLYFADYRWHFWGRVWRTPLVGELSMWLMNRWIFHIELRRGGRKLTRQHIREAWSRITPRTKRMILRLYRATDPACFAGWESEMLALISRVPTRVLWGARDPYIPVRYAERWGTDAVRTFADCGHWLPVEAAADVASELEEFFGR